MGESHTYFSSVFFVLFCFEVKSGQTGILRQLRNTKLCQRLSGSVFGNRNSAVTPTLPDQINVWVAGLSQHSVGCKQGAGCAVHPV